MNIVAVNQHISWSSRQLDLIRRTKAPDCTDAEFDLFIEAAARYGLDPLLNQITAIVFSKKSAEKRRMSLVVTIDGFRARAERCGDYRPDEDEPRIEYDAAAKDPAVNPLGIVKATVRVWKSDKAGHWHPITGVAYWDEFAPIKEEWAEDPDTGRRHKTDKRTLDGLTNWPKMPRVMIAKCAEAQALRRGWPDQLSGLYAPEELDQAKVIDLTATEIVEAEHQEQRLARIGGRDALMVSFDPHGMMERVPIGQAFDRIARWLQEECDGAADLAGWKHRNRETLKEFWARQKNDALALKKLIEEREAALLVTAEG